MGKMVKIAFTNQKGGVGKTSSVIGVGAALSQLNYKCLLVDTDPQAHLSISLGIRPNVDKPIPGIYEVLRGEVAAVDAIIKRDGERPLWILPSHLDLAGVELELAGKPTGREYVFADAMENVTGFDYVLIDCGPSLGLLPINTMAYCNDVIIPLQVEFLALQGMQKLLDIVELVRKRINTKLKVSGVICTMYDSRKRLHKEVVETVREYFGDIVFKTVIRDNISIAEAPSHGKSIFEYKADSFGAQDYAALAEEIIARRL